MTQLNIICRCVPVNPFYIRWINRYGGWDYWMFEKRQTTELNQNDLQLLDVYIDDFSTATGTTRLIGKSVEETVLVGADDLTSADWRIVSGVVKSSFVQWYSKEAERWVDVILSKQKAGLVSDFSYNNIELTLTLPTPQLAI